jgi:hypothetical protein
MAPFTDTIIDDADGKRIGEKAGENPPIRPNSKTLQRYFWRISLTAAGLRCDPVTPQDINCAANLSL